MFKQFINQVDGADVYLITTLILFVVTFLFIIFYLLTASKNHFREVSEVPLHSGELSDHQPLTNQNQ